MENVKYANCPIRNVIAKFGDKWSLLVLYCLHTSEGGVLRFGELHRQMDDCSQKMLTQTLKELEKNHLIKRKVYPEIPPKVEYSLTDSGKSLMPQIEGLMKWAIENFGLFVH